MARREQDREDLLKEATALVRRIELQIAGDEASVVIGFRENAAASFYLGPDRVYQFTPDGALRRAHIDGRIIKAESCKLASLVRERRDGKLQLIRHDFDPAETNALMSEMRDALNMLYDSLQQSRFDVVGRVPEDVDLVPEVIDAIETITRSKQISTHPNV